MMDGRKASLSSQKPIANKSQKKSSTTESEPKKPPAAAPNDASAGKAGSLKPKEPIKQGLKSQAAAPKDATAGKTGSLKPREPIKQGLKSPATHRTCEKKNPTKRGSKVTIDAKKIANTGEGRETPPLRGPRARMSVSAGSMEYNMIHPRRGKAVIFSHEIFDDHTLSQRKGTKKDEERLKEVLEKLEFEIEVHHDLTRAEVEDQVRRLSKEDHTDCDCLFVAVLTHGDVQKLYAKDYPYFSEEIWKPFGAYQCPSLAGKPKIFIIQACRGEGRDVGVVLEQTSRVQTDSVSCQSYKIPSMADFVIGNASFEGYVSFRDVEEGSWYIKSLCEVLEENYQNMDLLRMLTRASHKVAVEYIADTTDLYDACKQAPTVMSTLIRDVNFSPKNKQM